MAFHTSNFSIGGIASSDGLYSSIQVFVNSSVLVWKTTPLDIYIIIQVIVLNFKT